MLKNNILEYIGLNLEKIPQELKTKTQIHFNSYANVTNYKVYKYVPVDELEILITPLDRVADLKEKYKNAKPLEEYLTSEDSKIREIFENCLNTATIKEIEELEKLQERLTKETPYFVSYEKNYLWQIFYSEEDNKYFMLFPANEGETSVLFYIIKKKLEKNNAKIFVPVNKIKYSEKILSSKEIADIENYIYTFTQEWPNIYEVEDKIYITGHTKLDENLESLYRNTFTSKEKAQKFYLMLKAMFVLTTETNYKYKFNPVINKSGEIELKYNEQVINTSNLASFVDEQTELKKKEKIKTEKEIEENTKILKELQEYVKKQNEIYVMQEKQIVMFLECKKSFFKRIRYYLKTPKFVTPKINVKIEKEKEIEDIEIETESSYTIKELVNTTKEAEAVEIKARDIRADIRALKLKKENLARKIKNAEEYIKEIEKHKKSIFEFWKFSNKDELPALEEGNVDVNKKIQGIFNFSEDMETIGEKVDELQRKKLSTVECDAIFVSKYCLKAMNNLDNEEIVKELLDNLKKEKLKRTKNALNTLLEDYSVAKKVNNKKHRENKKDIFKILKITEDTSYEDFKQMLEKYKKLLDEAYVKIKAIANMPVYMTNIEGKYVIGDINPKNLLDKNVIYKTQINEGDNVIYFSNITLYDNTNRTLPLGMNVSTEVMVRLLENSKFVNEKDIYFLEQQNDFECKIREVKVKY